MTTEFARRLLVTAALVPVVAAAMSAGPAEAGVTASLVSNQIIATSGVQSFNYGYLNGQPLVDLSAAQSPYQGFSINALSDLNSNEILFKNGTAAVGFGTSVKVVTGVAVTFTNDQTVSVKPVLESTLLAAGLGIFLTPQLKSSAFGNLLGSDACTSGSVQNCGEPTAAQAAAIGQHQPIQGYGNSSSGFDFNVSVNGLSVYDLAGSVGVNANGLYSNLAQASTTLDGFSKITANGDPYGLGYAWDDTSVDIALPNLLLPGQSVTAIYTITTYVSMAANGGCLTGNIGYGRGAICETAYSSFGDPVGRGGGIGNGATTGLSPDILAPAGTTGPVIKINTDALGVFNLFTPVYDPVTGEYTAKLPATVLFPGGIPEPSTWALMLAGVGMLGGALRRNRRDRAQLAA